MDSNSAIFEETPTLHKISNEYRSSDILDFRAIGFHRKLSLKALWISLRGLTLHHSKVKKKATQPLCEHLWQNGRQLL